MQCISLSVICDKRIDVESAYELSNFQNTAFLLEFFFNSLHFGFNAEYSTTIFSPVGM